MIQDFIAWIIIACSAVFLIRLIYIRFKGKGNDCGKCSDCSQDNCHGNACNDCRHNDCI